MFKNDYPQYPGDRPTQLKDLIKDESVLCQYCKRIFVADQVGACICCGRVRVVD